MVSLRETSSNRAPSSVSKMKDQTLYDRLMAKIIKDEKTGCWLWQGSVWSSRPSPGNRYGYTSVWIPEKKKSRTMGTHKAMWWAVYGAPEKGMCVCHECDTPTCCNPDHLWLGTHLENMADCRAKGRYHYANLTHCKHGHEFNEENTYYIPTPGEAQGLRKCRACARVRNRIKAGWPADLAYSMAPTPKGYRPIGANFKATRS